ncbi:MAG TPA: heme exporter protein CcmB [Rhodospirillaceae bacterium]|nr:heme exporter protein CcmB [Candidatus Neomarinimicrobiota bacterium]HCX14901.1 heme exporter protein CcmB [Rhodospirillaceae bacterium]
MKAFFTLTGRDVRLAIRQSGDSLIVLAFFAMATVLFPFGIGPESAVLARIAGGVVWVTALLSALLSLDRLFAFDFEDGTLDQLILSGQPLTLIVLSKVSAHWLTTGVPLILLSPVLAVTLQLPAAGYGTLVLALAIGTPTVSLIGSVGAALVLGARRGGVLLSLLVLPLYIPVLIFGTGAVEAAIIGLPTSPMLMVLAGFAILAFSLSPWAASAALSQAVE